MRILAFESSAKAASVAILQDGALLGEYYQNGGQTHSRTLMQMAADLLRNCDLTAKDVDAVAVAAGPGKARAILAVLRHHRHHLLVIDEGAAREIERILSEEPKQ